MLVVCATLLAAAHLELVLVPIDSFLSTPPPTDKYDPTFATTKKSMPDVCTGFIFGTENEAGQPLLTPHYQDRKNYKCCLRCVLVCLHFLSSGFSFLRKCSRGTSHVFWLR